MTKRQRIVFTSIILSLGFLSIQFIEGQFRFLSIGVLGLLTAILFYWSLKEGIGFNMTLLSLVLPIYFTVGVGLFWFLLPTSIYARIPIVIIYGIGLYALSLTSNIYTVAAIRTIALYRAARGVGFVLTLFTFFLILDAILSLRESLWLNGVLVMTSSFLLFLQGFWSIDLEKRLSKKVLEFSLASSLIMGEIAFFLYFWPVTVVVGSLFFTVSCYMMLGLGQARLEGRFFKQTVREYTIVGIMVFLGMFVATRWGI